MTYNKLKDDILKYSMDDSDELQDAIPTIINQSEELVYHALPSLECYRKISGTGFNYTDKIAADHGLEFPDGIDVISSIFLSTEPKKIIKKRTESYVKELYGNEMYFTSGNHIPDVYFTRENRIIFAPITERVSYGVDIEGHGPLPRLSESNQSNWIVENAYNLLLSACMIEFCNMFRKDPSQYAAKFAVEKERLQLQGMMTMQSQSGSLI